MTKKHREIGDDEIRVIRSDRTQPEGDSSNEGHKPGRKLPVWTAVACIVLGACLVAWALIMNQDKDTSAEELTVSTIIPEHDEAPLEAVEAGGTRPYVSVRDTTIGGVGLRILTPRGANPQLAIGGETFTDSTAVLVAQAADTRADNGSIAGAFVLRGELISKGQAKAGYCAIIDGEITVGVAEASPKFEEAIEREGDFFRQYPLVVGGQVVENKPKGRALRKALAETDGTISVVVSKEALTFHDFSQALADAGIRNAIYLVGSSAALAYVDENRARHIVGLPNRTPGANVNYIVWK